MNTKNARLRTAADFKALAENERKLAELVALIPAFGAGERVKWHQARAAEYEAAADEMLAELAADDVSAPTPQPMAFATYDASTVETDGDRVTAWRCREGGPTLESVPGHGPTKGDDQ